MNVTSDRNLESKCSNIIWLRLGDELKRKRSLRLVGFSSSLPIPFLIKPKTMKTLGKINAIKFIFVQNLPKNCIH